MKSNWKPRRINYSEVQRANYLIKYKSKAQWKAKGYLLATAGACWPNAALSGFGGLQSLIVFVAVLDYLGSTPEGGIPNEFVVNPGSLFRRCFLGYYFFELTEIANAHN